MFRTTILMTSLILIGLTGCQRHHGMDNHTRQLMNEDEGFNINRPYDFGDGGESMGPNTVVQQQQLNTQDPMRDTQMYPEDYKYPTRTARKPIPADQDGEPSYEGKRHHITPESRRQRISEGSALEVPFDSSRSEGESG